MDAKKRYDTSPIRRRLTSVVYIPGKGGMDVPQLCWGDLRASRWWYSFRRSIRGQKQKTFSRTYWNTARRIKGVFIHGDSNGVFQPKDFDQLSELSRAISTNGPAVAHN